MKVAIVNLGQIVSGNWREPFASGDTIIIDGERIVIGRHRIGRTRSSNADVVIDAGGMTAIPGLIDSHVHITFGDYTPRQRTVGYLESYLHGGTTTAISASEVHVPGRPTRRRGRQGAGGRGAALLCRLPAGRHARHRRLGDPGARPARQRISTS